MIFDLVLLKTESLFVGKPPDNTTYSQHLQNKVAELMGM